MTNSSKELEYINICFACDERYVQHLCCTLVSLIDNKNKEDLFNIIILDGGISVESQNYIKELSKNHKVEFRKIDSKMFENCPLTDFAKHINSLSTYYRFLLSSITNASKILYLDCDLIVKNSLREFYDMDLENCYVAGVRDSYEIENCERLALSKYINAGVMLVNLDLWRNDNIEKKLFDWCMNNQDKIKWQDQDVLNVVLQDKIVYVPDVCNAQVSEVEFGTTKEFNQIAKKAMIVHYVGGTKPWQYSAFSINEYYIKNLMKTKYRKDYYPYALKFFLQNSFSIKNEVHGARKHKVVTVLGVKLKFKCKYTKINEGL